MAGVWIGTSGWIYDGWRGPFYPVEIPKRRWLGWYGDRFATTEINGSFYRTPSFEAVHRWVEETPDGFVFAWKASKFITHWKRLGPSCANSIALMETRLELLGPKLGPVLFQLPARFKVNVERLESFLPMLPPHRRYAFEFRDASWYVPEVMRSLRGHGVALCISDHHDAPSPWTVTADHVYIRGHGPDGRYRDNYSNEALAEWAARVERWRRSGKDVFVYFDNDVKSAAPQDAARLLALMASRPKVKPSPSRAHARPATS